MGVRGVLGVRGVCCYRRRRRSIQRCASFTGGPCPRLTNALFISLCFLRADGHTFPWGQCDAFPPLVRLEVDVERVPLRIGRVAQRADKGPLPRVVPDVGLQVVSHKECLVAVRTLVWLDTAVLLDMAPERLGAVVHLGAMRALELPRLLVHKLDVLDQRDFFVEGFGTHVTHMIPVSRTGVLVLHMVAQHFRGGGGVVAVLTLEPAPFLPVQGHVVHVSVPLHEILPAMLAQKRPGALLFKKPVLLRDA
jgi:hypothetical protein